MTGRFGERSVVILCQVVVIWLSTLIQAALADEPAQPVPGVERLPPVTRPTLDQNSLPLQEAQDIEAEPLPVPSRAKLETLEHAWEVALAVDASFDATRWNVASARSRLAGARAERFPEIVLDGGYTVRDNESSFVSRAPGLPFGSVTLPHIQREFFSFGVEARLPIHTGGRISALIDSASLSLEQAKYEAEAARMDLKLRVAEEFIAVLRAESDLEVARAKAKSLEAHTKRVQALFAQQRASRNDVLASQSKLSRARYEVSHALDVLDLARSVLNRRLGRPLSAAIRLQDLEHDSVHFDVQALMGRAIDTRPELRVFSARADALLNQARSERARSLPQAELRGGYSFQENRFQTPQGLASIGLGVNWTLYDGGRHQRKADALHHEAMVLQRLRADRESRIRLEVRKIWLHLNRAQRYLRVSREALQSAMENLRVAESRYQEGVGTNTEVLDANTLAAESRRSHVHARFDALVSYFRLMRATTGL